MILTGNSTDWAPHPEGQFTARCVDLLDLGMKDGQWGLKRKVCLQFYCSETTADGEPFLASRTFTASLHPKAALHKFLVAWRGRTFTDEELAGFDLETIVGAPAYVQVQHSTTGESTYANIISCMMPPKGSAIPSAPSGFVRRKDREDAPAESAPATPTVDDIPF